MSIDDRSRYSHKSIGQPTPKPVSPPATPAPSDTVAISANNTITATEERFRQHLDSIDGNAYTLDGLRKQLDQFDLRPVDNAIEKVHKRIEDAERDVQSIRDGLAPDHDIANQIHASRVWARAQLRLDKTEDGKLNAAVRDLIAATRPWRHRRSRRGTPQLPGFTRPRSRLGRLRTGAEANRIRRR
jgi:hypothetical protein